MKKVRGTKKTKVGATAGKKVTYFCVLGINLLNFVYFFNLLFFLLFSVKWSLVEVYECTLLGSQYACKCKIKHFCNKIVGLNS